MTDKPIFVDVGATWTRLVSARRTRRTQTHLEKLRQQIQIFIGKTPKKSIVLFVGMRGVWTASEKNKWKKELRGLSQKTIILSDIELKYRGVFGRKPGIVLNAGTGSIAYGQNSNKKARAGGMGPLLGDEGSAFWIGKLYLTQYHAAEWKKLRRLSVPEIAKYAKKALTKAQRGNKTCQNIVHVAQNHLHNLILNVRSQLKIKKPPIFLTGGLFQNSYFKSTFRRRFGR